MTNPYHIHKKNLSDVIIMNGNVPALPHLPLLQKLESHLLNRTPFPHDSLPIAIGNPFFIPLIVPQIMVSSFLNILVKVLWIRALTK